MCLDDVHSSVTKISHCSRSATLFVIRKAVITPQGNQQIYNNNKK